MKKVRASDIFWKAPALPDLSAKSSSSAQAQNIWARSISTLLRSFKNFLYLVECTALSSLAAAVIRLVEFCISSGEMKACGGPLDKLARLVAIQKSFI